jgi:DNA processing protein
MKHDLLSLLCLISIPGVGPYRIRNLIGRFGDSKRALEADISELCQVDGIDEKRARGIKQQSNQKFAEDQIRLAQKEDIQIVTFWDQFYPEILKKIYDPPILLFVKGCLEISNGIAIVGTRSPSKTGQWAAEHFSKGFVENGITVVSGMARGIDTWAHRGAVQNSGRTIAVLGSGVDVIYPPENRKLYHQIIEQGAVISEFPIRTEPKNVHFPRRNRIISGLSLGAVVVEAGEKSGALITAYMALEQGREVFAVPGSIRNLKSRGTHRLIKEGAKLVENVEDVFAEIPGLKKKGVEAGKQRMDVAELLSASEMELWKVLSEEPVHIDQIAEQAKIHTSEALALLLSMELKNCVRQLSGMKFIRQ